MSINKWCLRIVAAVAACAASAAIGPPAAVAAPATDASGYVDSTARCASPNQAVMFGSTATSRVAICETPSGKYEYRGVRLSDGAKLIVPASQTGDEFTAENDGITYFVSEKSLVISAGTRLIREEPMVDFHQPQGTAASAPTPTTSTKPLPPPLPAEVGGDG
jgi:hypothetical protein